MKEKEKGGFVLKQRVFAAAGFPNCDLMAIWPFHFTFSPDRLISLFHANPSFSSFLGPYNYRLAPFSQSFSYIIAFRHIAASAAALLSGPRKYHPPPQLHDHRPRPPSQLNTLAQKIGKSTRRPGASSKARVYADVNVVRPKDYWDYESLTVQWG